jgi:putative LysE/RhtB family amino acid efflux pump
VGLLLVGFGLGFFLAAQVGPVTLLIVRSVLRGGRAVAVGLAMAGAVALVDVLYAGLGLAGAGQLLDAGPARLALGVTSAAILLFIGARTLWRGLRARSGAEADCEVATPKQGFATALAATALNPLTIALWTVSFPASAPAAAGGSTVDAAAVLSGVAAGTLAWYCGFAAVVALARRRIGARLLAGIDVLIGSGLMLFGAVLGYRTLSEQGEA